MHGNNGIAQASNGTFYVINSPGGQLYVLDKQADNTLVITDVIEAGACSRRSTHPELGIVVTLQTVLWITSC